MKNYSSKKSRKGKVAFRTRRGFAAFKRNTFKRKRVKSFN